MVKGKKMEANTGRRFPDFLRVYRSQHSSERMLIPPDFVKHFSGVIPKKTILRRSGLGKQWHVEVGKTDSAVFFQNGWQQFVEENSVEEGESLRFGFNGGFFECQIFGHSMCEKGFPSIKEESKGEDDGDDIAKVIERIKNPCFVARRNDHGKRCKVLVPTEVIKDNNLILHSDMGFLDPSDRKWDGKVSIWKDGRTWIGGWDIVCKKKQCR